MGDELVGSNDAQRRTYVLRHGRFVTLPEGLQLVVPTKSWPVVEDRAVHAGARSSAWASRSFAIRKRCRTGPSPISSPIISGAEAVDYLAEPLLAGVYGGSPDHLSAASVLPKFVEYEQRYGSVVVGALREKTQAERRAGFQIAAERHGFADRCSARAGLR